MRAFQRVVATLAVASLLLAAGFDGLHHAAYAGHHKVGPTAHASMTHAVAPSHGMPCHGSEDTERVTDVEPAFPSDKGDANDCAHCCAAHCFACVIPKPTAIDVAWKVLKKESARGLFAPPPPTWRLERPPKPIV